MRRSGLLVLAAGLLALPLTTAATAAPAAHPTAAHRNVHVCAAPAAGTAACTSWLHVAVDGAGKSQPSGTAGPTGLNPADLQSAYALPSATAGSGQTVAIVDAYNDPNAESDLGVYRSQFGLPACTTANGCFRKVNQSGGTNYPKNNGGWAQEISLDLDMVSAVCPNCHILLVEASSASLTNLGTAVNEAVRLGAKEVSNSYSGGESSADTSYDTTYYNHTGVAVTASTGDSGYGTGYPATGEYVVGVGGTSLTRSATSRGWSETAWSSGGSGCSAYDPQPTWQSGVAAITSVCSKHAVADVSAVGDPATGVSVYDSFTYQGQSGWLVFGGTSVSSPIIGAVYGLAGGVTGLGAASTLYAHPSALFDVTSGSNGTCGTILCTATTGWDGPTGLGTPNGLTAF